MARLVHLTGTTPYAAAHALQVALVDARWRGEVPDVVLLLEHAPTITVGRKRGAADSVRTPADTPVLAVERGGDATWHGPGQLVAYPIVALQGPRRDLLDHLRRLEAGVTAALRALGLRGEPDARNTGVWLADPPASHVDHPADPRATRRKVAAIGIACRRWITWHGVSLNSTLDLGVYEAIRPCGFDPGTVTRLADHLPNGAAPSPAELAEPLGRHLTAALDRTVDGPVRRLDGTHPDLLDRVLASG